MVLRAVRKANLVVVLENYAFRLRDHIYPMVFPVTLLILRCVAAFDSLFLQRDHLESCTTAATRHSPISKRGSRICRW